MINLYAGGMAKADTIADAMPCHAMPCHAMSCLGAIAEVSLAGRFLPPKRRSSNCFSMSVETFHLFFIKFEVKQKKLSLIIFAQLGSVGLK